MKSFSLMKLSDFWDLSGLKKEFSSFGDYEWGRVFFEKNGMLLES
jgi:hypothetical protein